MKTAVDSSCQADLQASQVAVRPLLKWAGGKTQLLSHLLPVIPGSFGKYIEPFFGGGALFFRVAPTAAVHADINPELINFYTQIASDPDGVIHALNAYVNTAECFYATRALDWNEISPADAAARTLYLNKTCYNGLYRVNRRGQFNTPFGHYKNPRFCDEEGIRAASRALSHKRIVCADFEAVLRESAEPGDFIFLDPPYVPVSKYSDFKRYNREQFGEQDHRRLAKTVEWLHDIGCHVVLTNSNHPLVHELYANCEIETVPSKRHISCNGARRKGEDVIINSPGHSSSAGEHSKAGAETVPLLYSAWADEHALVMGESRHQPWLEGLAPGDSKMPIEPLCKAQAPHLPPQVKLYPSTRFMGSKRKMLPALWDVFSHLDFDVGIDLFAGSGVVGYLLKAAGKRVVSNDHLHMSSTFAKAMIENSDEKLTEGQARGLFEEGAPNDHFVEETFRGLYFSDEDNRLIDVLRANIRAMNDSYLRAVALAALVRACMKKRARGIFTYVGQRYDDGRKDLQTPLSQHFLAAVEVIDNAVFSNGRKNMACSGDALDVKPLESGMVYMDPPYYSKCSDNEYVRRYHFVEGLARDWEGVSIQWHTKTRKFAAYPTPFSSREGAFLAFDRLFSRFQDSILVVSYSSNAHPSMSELAQLLGKYKAEVRVFPVEYKYSFGNQGHKVGNNRNSVSEYLFVGT